MRFHDWRSAKSDLLAWARDEGHSAEKVRELRQEDPQRLMRRLMQNEISLVAEEVSRRPGWWSQMTSIAVDGDTAPRDYDEQDHLQRVGLGFQAVLRYQMELLWLRSDRPYYNVYPIVMKLAEKTGLDFPLSRVRLPYQAMLFRFPCGHEPSGLGAAIICTDVPNPVLPGDRRHPFVALAGGTCPKTGEFTFNMSTIEDYGDPDITVEASIGKQDDMAHGLNVGILRHDSEVTDRIRSKMSIVFRLAVIAAQLSEGHDLITPIVLEKDRERHGKADDAEKRWLEERAARVAGRGFDFGRDLQRKSDSSPHWRDPHLALFWTGKGRKTPLLRLRAGCLVMPRSLSEVPTGFLGPEKPEECDRPDTPIVYRVPIPKRLRFKVLRRDKYRCRLCGLTQDDGVQLEVDHRVPVAKGGLSTMENLWTLCHPCNNGKSDSDLHDGEAVAVGAGHQIEEAHNG